MGREYHWIMTLQWPNSLGGTATATSWGTVIPPQGSTRSAQFDMAFQHMRSNGAPANSNVIFFAFEPNEPTL